jgi:hypothetical protein
LRAVAFSKKKSLSCQQRKGQISQEKRYFHPYCYSGMEFLRRQPLVVPSFPELLHSKMARPVNSLSYLFPGSDIKWFVSQALNMAARLDDREEKNKKDTF